MVGKLSSSNYMFEETNCTQGGMVGKTDCSMFQLCSGSVVIGAKTCRESELRRIVQ